MMVHYMMCSPEVILCWIESCGILIHGSFGENQYEVLPEPAALHDYGSNHPTQPIVPESVRPSGELAVSLLPTGVSGSSYTWYGEPGGESQKPRICHLGLF